MLKNSGDKKWKVAFIQMLILKESQIFDKKLPQSKNLMLIHKIIGIESLGELIEQLNEGKQVRLGKIIASLEWIKERSRYDFKMRAYMKQTFHIDEACYIILKSGDYTDEIDSIIRELEPLDWKEHGAYGHLKDALDKILNVEWGKPAYPPSVRIFAPIYIRIEESKAEVQRLEVTISAALEASLSKIKLWLFGEEENGKMAKPIKPITTFKRRNDSDLMEPIVIRLDDETRFVKLNLYYGNDLLEDFYVRIPKSVIRSLIETIPISEKLNLPVATKVKIRQDKQEIKARYEVARDENNDANTKGRALEEVITKILELVPGLEIAGTRVTSEIQEVDIMVRNFNKTRVWADFESVFFVECKNWFKEKRPGAAEIGDLKRKLENKHLKTGIFVAPNGIAEGQGDNRVYGTNGQIDKYFSKGTIIVVLEHRDICAILDCKDATEQVNERFMDLYKMKSKPISSPDIGDPLKVLKIRFAEGEITKEQYEDMRKVLEL
jgi:hypothetical protein